MSPEFSSREAFATHFKTLVFETDVGAIGNEETIVPSSMKAFYEDVSAINTLPRMSVRGPGQDTLHPDLEVLGTLGEGGMGLVRLAQQVPLKRNVAVKTVRSSTHEQAADSLLKEAYVTGHLEHPNVIPIYTLGRDDAGAPLIVMKRIEGDVWLDLLTDEHARGELDLERHLEVLEQVCNAVRFAHSRGVLHRDIKPENVMIGAYDEVYLLDWGIAVSTDEDQLLLPRRSESVGVAGTPSYMAPEMTMDDAADVDERTDVYLLGATLHHILTGHPRHVGESVFEAMFAAVKSEPFDYDRSVPRGLAAIANKACAKDKADRFESATEFRHALEAWREHRASVEVAREARRSMDALRAEMERPRSDESDVLIHDLAGECRFGFRQALRMWPDNTAAKNGELEFLHLMFDFSIESEQPINARGIMSELGERATDEQRARLTELEARMEAERRKVDKLEKMADELDLRTATTSRSRLAALLGILWTISTCYAAYKIHSGPPEPNEVRIEDHMMTAIRSLAIVGVSVFVFRKRIFANLANRRLMYILFSVMGTMVVMRLGFWVLNTQYVAAQAAEFMLYGFSILVLGIISDLRICALSLCFFTPSLLGIVYPDYQLWIMAPFNLAVFFGLAWVWSPRQMDKRITIDEVAERAT